MFLSFKFNKKNSAISKRGAVGSLGFRLLLLLLLAVPSIASAENRALLVGIGAYDQRTTGWTPLHGDRDVELLKPLLQKRGFTDIRTLVNRQATKQAIVSELKSLAARVKPGDKVYFHFSGHGQPIRDDNRDEARGKQYDESIIPYDACRDSRKMGGKYVGQYHLIDDELCPLLDAIKRKLGKDGELFVAIDACFSKGIEKDEVTDLDPDLLRYVRGTDRPFTPSGHSSYLARVPKPKRFKAGAKLTVVTACGSDERNYEYKSAGSNRMYGSLSYYIYTLLKKDADFGRWRQCFHGKNYSSLRIFQPSQHPSIEEYE